MFVHLVGTEASPSPPPDRGFGNTQEALPGAKIGEVSWSARLSCSAGPQPYRLLNRCLKETC